MTNLNAMELNTMKVEELRNVARELQMPGAWKAKKNDMIAFIQNHMATQEVEQVEQVQEVQEVEIEESEPAEEIQEETQEESPVVEDEVKPEPEQEQPTRAPRRGRTRKIEVYKNGELLTTIDGLMETFKWVGENKITNVGWVKRSLRTGEETAAGYKYKEGAGYLFKYAE